MQGLRYQPTYFAGFAQMEWRGTAFTPHFNKFIQRLPGQFGVALQEAIETQ